MNAKKSKGNSVKVLNRMQNSYSKPVTSWLQHVWNWKSRHNCITSNTLAKLIFQDQYDLGSTPFQNILLPMANFRTYHSLKNSITIFHNWEPCRECCSRLRKDVHEFCIWSFQNCDKHVCMSVCLSVCLFVYLLTHLVGLQLGGSDLRDWQTAGALWRPPASPGCG